MEQEAWLAKGLATLRSQWTFFGQGKPMTHIDEQIGTGLLYRTDGWNGYPQARRRFLAGLVEHRVANPVVLGGDFHAFMANYLTAEPERPGSPVLATEFITTSISSDARPLETLETWITENPNIHYLEGRHRGYLALHLTPQKLRADLLSVSDVTQAAATIRLLRSFTVESGRPVILD